MSSSSRFNKEFKEQTVNQVLSGERTASEIAKELGILESIQVAKPTDGLWEVERTDEDQIGATYPELEWAMEQQKAGKTEADFDGREKEVMTIYLRFNRATQHKMNPIPVCEIPQELM